MVKRLGVNITQRQAGEGGRDWRRQKKPYPTILKGGFWEGKKGPFIGHKRELGEGKKNQRRFFCWKRVNSAITKKQGGKCESDSSGFQLKGEFRAI